MNEPQVTMIGNIAQELRHVKTDQGVPITSFRMASTRRWYDRAAGRWTDGETTFVNVTCWRGLADHVYASASKGDPVVVVGRLRVRPWERDGYKGNAVEIEAMTVGHDLTRGTAAFRRSQPRAQAQAPEREIADGLVTSMEATARQSGEEPIAGGEAPAALGQFGDASGGEAPGGKASGGKASDGASDPGMWDQGTAA